MEVPNEILALLDYLGQFNLEALTSGTGGLQLLPENADLIQRLELAAALAASTDSGNNGKLKRRDWRRFLNGSPLAAPPYRDYEDPYNNVFVEPFTFHGGSYGVFGENSDEPIYVAKRLADAIVMRRADFESSEFLRPAMGVVLATLLVSDEIVRRCGLEIPSVSPDRFRQHVIIPAQAKLDRLGDAAKFTQSQLDELLGKAGIDHIALAPMVCATGTDAISRWAPTEGPMLPAPIVRVDDVYVVVMPHALLSYMRHSICALAVAHGVTEQLARAYRQAVHHSVSRSISYLNNVPIDGSRVSEKPDWCEERLYRHDADKITHVVVACDPLSDYDPNEPFGAWGGAQATMDLMEARADEVASELMFGSSPPNETLHILTLQSIGRSFAAGVGGPKPPLYSRIEPLSGSDIEIICQLDGGNPLALWQFSRSASRVRERTQIQAWSRLDEFDLYYGNDRSYYLSDDGTPDFISVPPSGTKSVKAKAYSLLDMHGVPHPDGSSIVEVGLLHGDRQIPIYAPLQRSSGLQLLVQLPEVMVWITSEDRPPMETRALLFQFADMIAYWCWQMAPSVQSLLLDFRSERPFVEVRLEVVPGLGWTNEGGMSDSGLAPVESRAVGEGFLAVKLSDSLAPYFGRPDNYGERIIMESILLKMASSTRTVSPDDIRKAVDTHAPIGLKKKLHFTSSLVRPELAASSLPSERLIQNANQDWILDEMRDFLAGSSDFDEGGVEPERQTQMLGSIVSYLFEALEKEVARLSPEGLLETLVLHNERLLYEHALFGLTLPTQIACFGESSELMNSLQERTQKHGLASGASRFLVEYVVAQAPNGYSPISLSVYDRLLALAGMIINYGSTSDLVHHELAIIEMRVLGSGRLGMKMEGLDDAMKTHRNEFILGELDKGISSYSRDPNQTEDEDRTLQRFSLIDESWDLDYGFSFTDVIEFTNRSYEIALESEHGLYVRPMSEFEAKISESLGWNAASVESLMAMLSLTPRESFVPSETSVATDVYPWRFNRELSYLRRPILVRENSGGVTELIIAPRICTTAARYLFNLCWSGRLKGAGPAISEAMEKLAKSNAEEFNHEVAAHFGGRNRYIVRTKVKKVAGELLARANGEPIGDIDVLVVDSSGKELLLLETKDLSFAGNPAALSHEIQKLFGKDAGDKSTVTVHMERAAWVERNIKKALSWLGVDQTDQSGWKVRPMIITSAELISPYIRNAPFEVMSFRQLREKVRSRED